MKGPVTPVLRLAAIRRAILSVLVGSFVASLAGAALGLQVAVALRGRNVSDVGVPMWEHGDLAFAAAAASYLAVVFAGWFVGRLLGDPVSSTVAAVSWVVRLVLGAVVLLAIRVAC